MNKVEAMLMKLPTVFGWIRYKDEEVFISVNYEATKKANKPMVDVHYCATEALNNKILFTCQYDKSKFKPSLIDIKKASPISERG